MKSKRATLKTRPSFTIGDRVRVTSQGLHTLDSMYQYHATELLKQMQHDEIVDRARRGMTFKPGLAKDPVYRPNPENTLQMMLDGVKHAKARCTVVGVLLQYGLVMGHAANACYLNDNPGISSGPKYHYQVLVQWPHQDPAHGEMCFVFEFGFGDIQTESPAHA